VKYSRELAPKPSFKHIRLYKPRISTLAAYCHSAYIKHAFAALNQSPTAPTPPRAQHAALPDPAVNAAISSRTPCVHCERQHGGVCYVQYPDRAPEWWLGTPKGNKPVYIKYVRNARACETLSEADIRDFWDSDDRRYPARTIVPAQVGQQRATIDAPTMLPDGRTQHPYASRGINANLALQQSLTDDDSGAAASMRGVGQLNFSGMALSSRLPFGSLRALNSLQPRVVPAPIPPPPRAALADVGGMTICS
jgi:hypothetical protein